jgi:hypothetical protein
MELPNQIRINANALGMATPAQIEALIQKATTETVREVVATGPTFGLPQDYIAIRIEYTNGQHIYGGIGPDGSIST